MWGHFKTVSNKAQDLSRGAALCYLFYEMSPSIFLVAMNYPHFFQNHMTFLFTYQTPTRNRSRQTPCSRLAGLGRPRNTVQHSQSSQRRFPTGYLGMRPTMWWSERRTSMCPSLASMGCLGGTRGRSCCS